MSLQLIFILTVLTLILIFFRKRRYAVIFSCLTLGLFYLIWSGWLPSLALDRLQRAPYLQTPAWKQKNVIILLGAGAVRWSPEHTSTQPLEYSRLYEAARLYFDCRKTGAVCHVLATGGDPLKIGESEAAILSRELQSLQIPPADITAETESRNTFQNAKFSAPLIESAGYDYEVLVTSSTHMPRAQLFFTHFGVLAEPAPSNHIAVLSGFKLASRNFYILDIALHEHVGVLQYHWYNLMGWNPPRKF